MIISWIQNIIKIAGILVSKSTIYTTLKKYDEALACLEKAQKMIGQIQNNQRKEYFGQLLCKKATIYSERKGEEYKAEDLLKEYMKWADEFHSTFAYKNESFYKIGSYFEAMAGYLKVLRHDKVESIQKEIRKELISMGEEESFASGLTAFFEIHII